MTTVKDRIAQLFYVLGCLGAMFWLGWSALVCVMITAYDSRAGDWVGIPLLLGLALGTYGTGWALRWVINGTSTTVFSRGK